MTVLNILLTIACTAAGLIVAGFMNIVEVKYSIVAVQLCAVVGGFFYYLILFNCGFIVHSKHIKCVAKCSLYVILGAIVLGAVVFFLYLLFSV